MLSFMYSCSILITKSSCQSIKILDHTFSYNSFSFVAYLILLKNLQWNWVMKSFHIFCKLFTRWSDFMVGCFLQHTYTHTQTHTILTFLLTPISVRRPKSQFFNQVIIFWNIEARWEAYWKQLLSFDNNNSNKNQRKRATNIAKLYANGKLHVRHMCVWIYVWEYVRKQNWPLLFYDCFILNIYAIQCAASTPQHSPAQ